MADIEVEAYAGSAYPQRPLRVRWRGRWRRVAQVLAQSQHPDRRCFVVLLEASSSTGGDDTKWSLCYDYANDVWEALPLGGQSDAMGGR